MTLARIASKMRSMAPTVQTPNRRLADLLLGENGPLESFVRSRRSDGRAWRLIARDLYEATELDLTYETLRSWFPDEPEDGAA